MNKNLGKKLLAFTLVGGICASSLSVNASTLVKPELISNEKQPIIEMSVIKDTMYDKLGDTYMVPLRKVAEDLGMSIIWDEDSATAQIKHFTKALQVGLDGSYTTVDGEEIKGYEKAVLKDGHLYVPSTLLVEKMPIDEFFMGDEIAFRKDSVNKDYSGFGEVLEVNEGSGALLVTIYNNFDQQKYTLVVGDDTEVTDGITDETVKGTKIKAGDFLYSEFSPIMTRSMPPQTAASKIEIMNDYAISYGVVEEIRDGKIIMHSDTIGNIHLNLLEGAVIETDDGKAIEMSDLQVGDQIRVYHSQVMLMMMPTTYPTVKIVKA